MQILINIILLIMICFIIFKLIEFVKIYNMFDSLIIQFIKITNELKTDQHKAMDVLVKSVDKLNKTTNGLSYIKQEVDTIHRESIGLHNLNSQYGEHINTSNRTTKEILNILKTRINDIEKKTNNMSSLINKFDIIQKHIELKLTKRTK